MAINKTKLIKAVIAAAVIGSAALYLLSVASSSSWAYYLSVDEFTSAPQTDSIIRLAGTVKPGSIIKSNNENKVKFILSGEKSSIKVIYNSLLPRNFEPQKEIVVQGRLSPDNTFHAQQIITRCESKYKAKLKKTL